MKPFLADNFCRKPLVPLSVCDWPRFKSLGCDWLNRLSCDWSKSRARVCLGDGLGRSEAEEMKKNGEK